MSRFGWVLATYVAVLGVAVAAVVTAPKRLLWNASASAPVGLYVLRSARPLRVGELVVVQAPEPLARFMAARRYLPLGVPLLKQVIALPGAKVCRFGDVILVNGQTVGFALVKDRLGRPLPVWQGCRAIPHDQVFLMNRTVRDSFDGRYFGLLSAELVVARAVPIWTDETGRGRFQWRPWPRRTAPFNSN